MAVTRCCRHRGHRHRDAWHSVALGDPLAAVPTSGMADLVAGPSRHEGDQGVLGHMERQRHDAPEGPYGQAREHNARYHHPEEARPPAVSLFVRGPLGAPRVASEGALEPAESSAVLSGEATLVLVALDWAGAAPSVLQIKQSLWLKPCGQVGTTTHGTVQVRLFAGTRGP